MSTRFQLPATLPSAVPPPQKIDAASAAVLNEMGKLVASNQQAIENNSLYLKQMIAREAQQLRAHIGEKAVADLNATTLKWSPKLFDSWYLQGILVILPVGTTSATLVIGHNSYPIQNTETIFSPLSILVTDPTRSLTWSPASSTVQTTVELWGIAAAANYQRVF